MNEKRFENPRRQDGQDSLVIGISSRALFDLRESHAVFESRGLAAYADYQVAHEDSVLEPGVLAFGRDRGPGGGGAPGRTSCSRDRSTAPKHPSETRKKLADEYRGKFNNPYYAAGTGYVDDIIEPRESRPKIIAAQSALRDKYTPAPPRKHGNIPV